jgi:hypothetical protein
MFGRMKRQMFYIGSPYLYSLYMYGWLKTYSTYSTLLKHELSRITNRMRILWNIELEIETLVKQ